MNRLAQLCATATIAASAYGVGTLTTAPNTPDYQGAIRCTGGVWAPIADSGHQPTGIGTITATSTYLQVDHVAVPKVGSVQANGDSDYQLQGITVPGASGGLSYDRLQFFRNGQLISPAAACDLPYTNVWITGWAGE